MLEWLGIRCMLMARRGVQAEHKLVESSWPASMGNLMGEHSILFASAAQHKTQRHILSQVGAWITVPVHGVEHGCVMF